MKDESFMQVERMQLLLKRRRQSVRSNRQEYSDLIQRLDRKAWKMI